MNTNKKQ